MDRRWFLCGAAAMVAGTVVIGKPWRMRRALIRLGLTSPPANRLRNAGFLQSTVAGIPDYWGTGAPADGIDVADAMTVVGDGPVPGALTLRLRNPTAGYRFAIHSMKTFVPEPTPYTFSVYLRSREGAGEAWVTTGWAGPQSQPVTPEWQRYEVPYTPVLEARAGEGFGVSVGVNGPGTIEMSAPQLELGERATTFGLALMDDHPLPREPWPPIDRAFIVPPGATRVVVEAPFVFGIALHECGEAQLDDVAAHGFNAVVCFVPLDGVVEAGSRIASTLDAAHRRSLKVLPFFTGAGSLDERQARIAAAIHDLRAHPAVFGWIVLDEPSRSATPPDWKRLERFYREIRQADPNRPVIINDNVWTTADAVARRRSSDYGSVDTYPIGAFENPLAIVADTVSRLNADCLSSGVPTAFWQQLYGWNDVAREPTVAEARAAAYLAFVWGTRMLLHWVYKPMQQALWREMPRVAGELAAIRNALSDDGCQWIRAGTSGRRVHYAVWQGAARSYVIACNASKEPVFAAVDVTALAPVRWKAWHGHSRTTLEGRRLRVWLAPYEREVFEFAA